jgi:hypothetical protein
LGSLTSGVGVDATESVNAYVQSKLIHPDLQNPSATQISSDAREDNYRGEYPCIDPSNGAVYDDTNPQAGSLYPLTNKLDYCFAGRDFIENEPFAGGWTKVGASDMEDTWTSLDKTANFARKDDEDTDGNPLDADGNKIDMVSYDFSNVQDDDLDGGVLYVKAVYTPGAMLNSGSKGNAHYVVLNEPEYSLASDLKAEDTVFGVSFQYGRINNDGYGVTRAHEPKVRMDLTQDNASQSTAISVDVENGEVIDVQFTPSYHVASIDYQLIDVYGENIIRGSELSDSNDKTIKNIDGLTNGYVYTVLWPVLLQYIYDITYSGSSTFADTSTLNMLQLKNATNQKEFSTNTHVTQAKTYLKKYIGFAIADGQDWHTLTYYQVQYAICGKVTAVSKYKNAADCETYCKENYTWCQE